MHEYDRISIEALAKGFENFRTSALLAYRRSLANGEPEDNPLMLFMREVDALNGDPERYRQAVLNSIGDRR